MREPIIASEGHVLTNGSIFGKIIYLAEGLDASTFYEITDAKYESIMNAEFYDDESLFDNVTEEDYQEALGELGVKL